MQVIYDLLVKNSGPLELREDPDQGVCVAGLKHIQVTSAAEIMVRARQQDTASYMPRMGLF